MKTSSFILLFCCSAGMLTSQDFGLPAIPPFSDGIYLTFEDWKLNDPIPFDRVLSNRSISDIEYAHELFRQKYWYFQREDGDTVKVRTSETFGYAIQHNMYLSNHVRITIVGAICHYFIPKEFSQLKDIAESGMTLGALAVPRSPVFMPRRGDQQYMIDFATGQHHKFNYVQLEKILRKDPELHRDFQQAKGKLKDKLFRFLVLYNKKHPISFPEEDRNE